jgi:hypothetical protein
MEFPAPEPRREVTVGGRFFGMGIFGSAVIAVIMMEKFASAETQSYALPILGGALVLGILLPMLLFRRTVQY